MGSKKPAWGLVLKATEAGGGFLAPHLPDIEAALNGDADSAEIHYTLHGQCQIQLPPEFDEKQAHALASRLNGLTDGRGRPLLEVEITSESPPVLRGHPARSLTP